MSDGTDRVRMLISKSAFSIVVFLQFGCLESHPGIESNRDSNETLMGKDIATANNCDYSAYAPIRINQFDPKFVVKKVQPRYPEDAMQRRIRGEVVVRVLINENGDVARACAIKGNDALRSPAERAALQWKFKPGYGLAFSRPKTKEKPENFAEFYIVFDFRSKGESSHVQ